VFDYLIVGAGFAGSVVAERLARGYGKKVLLIDRRNHVGGNAYDHYNEHGVLVHRYGPHIFHTNSDQVFQYLSQFTSWRCYEHRVLSYVDGKLVPVPINRTTVNLLYNLSLTSDEEVEEFFRRQAEPRSSVRTSEDVVVSKVGRDLYEKLFRNYTRKQWGKDPSELDALVTARIPVRTNTDDRYFTDRYQAMPKFGYTRMFENMLDDSNIRIQLGCEYRDAIKESKSREIIFTGPVDEFFEFRFGELPYRSLRFEHETLQQDFLQPVAVVNYPNDHAYTRITEFKHLTGQAHRQTSVVYEYPASAGDPYYPVPTPENAFLYKRYAELAGKHENVHFVGRLATYRYYNMDQVVAQALTLCKQLVAAPEFAQTAKPAATAAGRGLIARPAFAG
jgi:UDP-galactopyranose mutase